jgi:hypothetical protein
MNDAVSTQKRQLFESEVEDQAGLIKRKAAFNVAPNRNIGIRENAVTEGDEIISVFSYKSQIRRGCPSRAHAA